MNLARGTDGNKNRDSVSNATVIGGKEFLNPVGKHEIGQLVCTVYVGGWKSFRIGYHNHVGSSHNGIALNHDLHARVRVHLIE